MTNRESQSVFERLSSHIQKVHPAAALPAIALGAWIMAPVLVIGETDHQEPRVTGAGPANTSAAGATYVPAAASAGSGSPGSTVLQPLFGVAAVAGGNPSTATGGGGGSSSNSGGGTNSAKQQQAPARPYAARPMPAAHAQAASLAAPLPAPTEVRRLTTANVGPASAPEMPPSQPALPARNEATAPVERPPVMAPRAVFPFPVVVVRPMPFAAGRPMPMGRYYVRGAAGSGGGRR